MLLKKIQEAIHRINESCGVSKYDVQELDAELNNLLLPLVNLNEFSKFQLHNDKRKLVSALEDLHGQEAKVSGNVNYIITNIAHMRDFIEKIKDIQSINEVDEDKTAILLDGGLTGEKLKYDEPWYVTLDKKADKIIGVLTKQQEELLDILLDNKERLSESVYGSLSFYRLLEQPEFIINEMNDSVQHYENIIIENPTNPSIYSYDLVWLLQYKKPLNLTIAQLLSELTAN